MSSLSREEKEALLNAKMEQIRQKNAALEKRHKEILADREIAAKTGSIIQPMQVSTSSSNRHSRNMDQVEDWPEDPGNQGPRNRDRKARDWDNHDNRDQMPAEPHHERPNRERAGQDNGDHASGEVNRERPNRDRNRPAPNRGPKHSPRDRNQEPSNESPKDMKGVHKDEDRRSSKYATGRGKRLAKLVNKDGGVEDSGHPRSPGGPRSPRSPGGHLQSPGGHPTSPAGHPRSPGGHNNTGPPHFPQGRSPEEGRGPRGPGGRNQGRPHDAHQPQGPHMDRGPRSQGGRGHPGQGRPHDAQQQRSNSPPPDPNFNFLADRSRSGPLPEQRRRNEEDPQRHPRNYGGSNFNQVKDRIQIEKQKSRRGGRQGGGDLSVQMTGRERREYAEWKAERERIDQARIQRQQDQSGEWKRAWDHEKEDFDSLPEPPVSRTEPGRRPAGRIGSGRFDRGEVEQPRGAADPQSPDQAPKTQPPLRYAEPRDRDRGRGRQRGRGQGRGRGRGGHDVVPGDRRIISTQGNDEPSTEPSQELLVVKIDNDYASKFKSKPGRRNEPRKRRSPRSSESSTGSYTAMPVKPSITMVASPTQSVGDEEEQEEGEVPVAPAPRPQRRVGSGRLANGRSHPRREGRPVPKPAPAAEAAAEEDDDDEWEDVEDGEVIYDEKGVPIPLTDLDFDDIQDMHNSSAESLDRFIRENTLHIDEETGLAAQLQHQESLLDDSDDSIPETPEHLCKPNVPNWGVALDLHNTSMSSDTSDPYMMDDAFGSHEPAIHGLVGDEGAEEDPSEASTVEDVKTASLVEERSLKAEDVKPEAAAAGDAGDAGDGGDGGDGDSTGSTSQETSIADEVAASPGPEQPDGDDGSFAEALPQASAPADSTGHPADSSLSDQSAPADSTAHPAADSSLSDQSLLSADASSTSLTSEFVDASENQPLTEKEEQHVDSKDEDESFEDAGEEVEQPKDQNVSEPQEPGQEDSNVDQHNDQEVSELQEHNQEVSEPQEQEEVVQTSEEPDNAAAPAPTSDTHDTQNSHSPVAVPADSDPVTEETSSPPDQPALDEPSSSSAPAEPVGETPKTENSDVPKETENSEEPAEQASDKSPDSASQESSGATSDVPQEAVEK